MPAEFHRAVYRRVWWQPWTWAAPVGFRVERAPEWDADSLTLVGGYLAYQDDLGPHGIPMSHATDPERTFRADPAPTRDFAAAALARAQKPYYKQWPDSDRAADLWRVEEVTE